MGATEKRALVILSAAAVIAGLYFFRGALTQIALAGIIWLGVMGFAEWIQARFKAPAWAALATSGLCVLAMVAFIGVLLAQSVADIASEAPAYRDRLDGMLETAYAALTLPNPPTVETIGQRFDLAGSMAQLAQGVRGILADALFVLIYVGFIFGAARAMPRKLDRIFPERSARERIGVLLTRIRRSMENYLWTQTVLSLAITAFTFATLAFLGLDNPIFWSLLIFFLNYIPTVGSILATALPTLAALVQFPDTELWRVGAVAAGVGFWQFFIGNFVQPRVMGDSLNLSALVVLISLSLWGLVWGVAGAFLSAPLTVAIMIVLAQFDSTRWIAILLSADGRPETAGHKTTKERSHALRQAMRQRRKKPSAPPLK